MHLDNSLLPLVSRISEILLRLHFIRKSIIIASLRKCFCKQVRRNIGWSFEIWELFPMATKMQETSYPQTGPEATFTVFTLNLFTLPSSNGSIAFHYLPVSPPHWNLLEGRPAFHFHSPGFLVQVNSIHKGMNKKIKDHWDLYELTRSRSLVNIVPTKVGWLSLLFRET